MALEHIKTDGTENGETAADKINLGFDQTDDNKTELDEHSGYINTNIADISVHDGKIDTLEADVTDIQADIVDLQTIELPSIFSISGGAKGTKTLVANTAEMLKFASTEEINYGPDIEMHDTDDEFKILTAGFYKVYGVITLTAPNNDIVDIELYIDNEATGYITSMKSVGDDIRITFPSTFITSFEANDEVALFVKSTGTEITVKSASMTVEKTPY